MKEELKTYDQRYEYLSQNGEFLTTIEIAKMFGKTRQWAQNLVSAMRDGNKTYRFTKRKTCPRTYKVERREDAACIISSMFKPPVKPCIFGDVKKTIRVKGCV